MTHKTIETIAIILTFVDIFFTVYFKFFGAIVGNGLHMKSCGLICGDLSAATFAFLKVKK